MKYGHALYWSMIVSLCKNEEKEIINFSPLPVQFVFSDISTSLIKPVQQKPTNYDPSSLPSHHHIV